MKPRAAVLIWGFACLAATDAAGQTAPASGFSFHLPDGWTDLKKAPPSDLAFLPPQLRSAIQGPQVAFLAMDLEQARRSGDPFATANLNVLLRHGDEAMTDEFVAKLGHSIGREVTANAPGAVYHLLESGVVMVTGVRSARFVQSIGAEGRDLRQLVYFIPGGTQYAVLTYTCPASMFEHYRPVFDDAARSTIGAHEPPGHPGLWSRYLGIAWKGALIGGAIGLLLALSRRRKR